MTESIHPEIHPEYIRGFQNGLSAHAEKQRHEIAPHSSENWDDEAWVRSFLQAAREWKPVGQWPGPKVLDAIERLAFGEREVRGVTVLFGLGAFIVNTGTSDGQPAVFVDNAPEPGQVGSKAPNVPAETVPRLRLLFPTAEQAARVADALVNAQPAALAQPAAQGGDGAAFRFVEYELPQGIAAYVTNRKGDVVLIGSDGEVRGPFLAAALARGE